jgi:hypothetical protein
MKLFRILFAFDALCFLGLLYFFVTGIGTATPGSGFIEAWIPLLLVPAAVLAVAWVLKRGGRTTGANVLLALLAAPFLLYGLFVGLFVLLDPDMR